MGAPTVRKRQLPSRSFRMQAISPFLLEASHAKRAATRASPFYPAALYYRHSFLHYRYQALYYRHQTTVYRRGCPSFSLPRGKKLGARWGGRPARRTSRCNSSEGGEQSRAKVFCPSGVKVYYELGLRLFCRRGDFSIPFSCGKDATPQTAQAPLQSAGVLFEALLHSVCLKLCLNASP